MGAALFVGGPGGLWSGCAACTQIDTADWLFCDDEHQHSLPSKTKSGRRRRAKDTSKDQWHEVSAQHLEELTQQLFKIHDLNGDGLLQESELITLNEQIAILHHGKDTDTSEVKSKYHELFRTKLDPEGNPVPYEVFREYAVEVLDGIDNDPEAQEMILEQFVAEALSGRQAFDLGITALLGLAPEAIGTCEGPLLSTEVAVVTLADESLKSPPTTPRVPASRHTGLQRLAVQCSKGDCGIETPPDVNLLDDNPESSQGSPASGGKEDAAEDLAGCSTDAPSPRRGAAAAESSTEEAMSSAEAGTAGPSVAKLKDGPPATTRPPSEETAPGDLSAIPHAVTESSLDSDLPNGTPRIPGSLVVEQRSVRRASCCSSEDEGEVNDERERSSERGGPQSPRPSCPEAEASIPGGGGLHSRRPRPDEPVRADPFEDLAPGPL